MEEREAQLAWERRFAPWAAAASFGAVILGVVAQAFLTTASTRSNSDREALRKLHDHTGEQIGATIAQSLSAILLGLALLYLLRGVRSRRTEGLPPAILGLLVVGPVLYTVGNVLNVLDAVDLADKFSAGAQTEARADALLKGHQNIGAFIGLAGTFAIAFSVVMVSLNAMRVGLLTRFMGILGIVLGALYVIPILGGPVIVQIFGLGALGIIFLGRWPGGRGEAWATGEAGVWLSAAEPRRQAMRAEQLEAEPAPAEADEDEFEEEREPEDLDARPHPTSKKRRKRRR